VYIEDSRRAGNAGRNDVPAMRNESMNLVSLAVGVRLRMTFFLEIAVTVLASQSKLRITESLIGYRRSSCGPMTPEHWSESINSKCASCMPLGPLRFDENKAVTHLGARIEGSDQEVKAAVLEGRLEKRVEVLDAECACGSPILIQSFEQLDV
jgi:hypothetical protein